jgi:hypothetical protein
MVRFKIRLGFEFKCYLCVYSEKSNNGKYICIVLYMKYFETGKKSFINDLKGFKKCLFFVSFQNLNWVDELVVDHPFLDEPCRYVNRSCLTLSPGT